MPLETQGIDATEKMPGRVGSGRGHRFVFVGGCARSGTTLVQNVLDSHPDICGPPEFMLAPEIMALRGKLQSSIEKRLIDKICNPEQVDNLVASLLEELLLPMADESGCRLLSEKSPPNVFVFRQLMELFPGARFVFVIRDPRAIISSMFQVRERARRHGWTTSTGDFTKNLFSAISYVKRCFCAGFDAVERQPNRVALLIYERLVSNPDAETRRLCSFLNLDWCETMLHPEKQQHPGEEAITNNVWYDKQMYRRKPDREGIAKWKLTLTRPQQATIARAFRGDRRLEDLGYDFSRTVPFEGFFGSVSVSLDLIRRAGSLAERNAQSVQRLARRYRWAD